MHFAMHFEKCGYMGLLNFTICEYSISRIFKGATLIFWIFYLPTTKFSNILCASQLLYPILLKCRYCQIHWHNYQAIFFPNLNISIKHRQIGGQSVRLALHKRFSTTVGCRFARRRIRWFQQSRDSLKRRESSDVMWCLSGERRPYKSFSARPIVGFWMLSFPCWHSRSEFKYHWHAIFQFQ